MHEYEVQLSWENYNLISISTLFVETKWSNHSIALVQNTFFFFVDDRERDPLQIMIKQKIVFQTKINNQTDVFFIFRDPIHHCNVVTIC